MTRNTDDGNTAVAWLILISAGLIIIGGAFWALPRYGVYSQQMAGEAKLREAESSRQIAVLEAKARMESASLNAQSEVARAKGVAEANQIIGESLKNNSEYLQYLYITGLAEQQGNEGDRTVIYVPTERGLPLPVLESGRLTNPSSATAGTEK